jgi:biotin carboxyl carrier protein
MDVRRFRVRVDGREYVVEVSEEGEVQSVERAETRDERRTPALRKEEPREIQRSKEQETSSGGVAAPIAGRILRVLKREGDGVNEGDVVIILEAMKMENEIYAPKGGKVKRLYVEESQLLCEIS